MHHFDKALKRRDHLVNGSSYFVIYGWVVKSDLFANRLTYWSTGQTVYQERPVGQWVDRLVKNLDLLVNGSTGWPTPYNWRVGYSRSGCKYDVRIYKVRPIFKKWQKKQQISPGYSKGIFDFLSP